MAIAKMAILIVVFLSAGVTPVCTSTAVGEEASARVVHFPEGRSLGMLRVRDSAPADVGLMWWWGHFTEWEYLGEATGDVTVPSGKELALMVSPAGWQDLSALTQLNPDDLQVLAIQCDRRTENKPGDESVPHIAHLSGLDTLILQYTNITNEGLKPLKGLKSLTRLSFISEQLDDAGLAHIAELQSLKGLRFYGPKVTDQGLSSLSKLTPLEDLFPHGSATAAQGLAHLAKLPRLRYLVLGDGRAGDEAISYLKNFAALRKLELLRPKITDTWLENLSGLKQVEELAIRNVAIEDEQVAHLKPLHSLKKITLQAGIGGGRSGITDAALASLTQIPSLEFMELYYGKFTDEGLAHLAELGGLKHLAIPNCHSFTDAGLKHLVKLRSLEELNIGSGALTDAGMFDLAQVTSLRDLRLFNARSIGNEGVAALAALKELTRLELFAAPKVTTSGLNHINSLTNLTDFQASVGYEQQWDGSTLQLGQLTRLERLAIAVWQDEDMACLANLKNLKFLQITVRGPVTDKGIAHLQGLAGLDTLLVENVPLTDMSLASLANMKRLTSLGISGNFTAEGLRHLGRLTGLTYLRVISETPLSQQAVQDLQAALPNIAGVQTETRPFSGFTKLLVSVGERLPDFEGIKIDFAREQSKGRMILICFFDMNQRPSRNCLLQLSRRAQELEAKSVVVVPIQALKTDENTLHEWVEKSNIRFPVGIVEGEADKTLPAWGVKLLPWMILTDANHNVIAAGFGLEELDTKIGTPSSRDTDERDIISKMRSFDEAFLKACTLVVHMRTPASPFNQYERGQTLTRITVILHEGAIAVEREISYTDVPAYREKTPATEIDYSPDGRLIVWRYTRERSLIESDFQGHQAEKKCLLVSPDGQVTEHHGRPSFDFYRPSDMQRYIRWFHAPIWATGRGLASSLTTVTEVHQGEDGLISFSASGFLDPRIEGTWQMVVDPKADCLIRSACFTASGSDTPSFECTTSGTKWFDAYCLAERANIGRLQDTAVTEQYKPEPNMVLLDEFRRILRGPLPEGVVVYDWRPNPQSVVPYIVPKSTMSEQDVLNETVDITADIGSAPSLVGKSLPEFEALGVKLRAADVSDTRMLVCFFDMEQRPSRNCLLQLRDRTQELKAKDVVVVTVQAAKADENVLKEWVKNNNILFLVGMVQGDGQKTRFAWGVKSLPWLILTNRDGVVGVEGFGIGELDDKIRQLDEEKH
jgi:Leucine-rich repeat (LRR) protein